MTRRVFAVHLDLAGSAVPMATVDAEVRDERTLRVDLEYDPGYLARPYRIALDPSVPLSVRHHVTSALPRGLLDAGPDGWGRRLMLRARRGEALSDVDYVLGVDDLARIGALRLATAESEPEFVASSHEIPRLVAIDDLAASALAVEEDPDDLAAVRRLLEAGSANLGGVRPKASIVVDGHLSIAKFSSTTDEIDAMAWEKVCLDLAADAGVAVPRTRLHPLGRGRALLLERFDRTEDDHRIPYLSAFTLSGAADPASGDYLDLAESFREFDVADYSRTVRDLWRRAAVNIALRNTDDHLKNHGLLWFPGGWELSPAFDITPNPIDGIPRTTTLDGEGTPAREARALGRVAEALGIAPAEQAGILDDVLRATSRWQAAALDLGIPAREIAMLDRPLTGAQARLAAERDRIA